MSVRERFQFSNDMARKQFSDCARRIIIRDLVADQAQYKLALSRRVKISHFPDVSLFAAFWQDLRQKGRYDPVAVAETMKWLDLPNFYG